jgi:hypothetical protein
LSVTRKLDLLMLTNVVFCYANSPLNSILRSASFHGTSGMAGGSTSSHGSAATSEDEATLSADEEECPAPV